MFCFVVSRLTGCTSQGSLTCPGQSAGFDLTGPADFLSAQSDTELWLTDLHISDYLNIHCMIFRPATYKKLLQYTFNNNKVGLRQHLNTFRVVYGLPNKTQNNADTKLTMVMLCLVVIRSTQRHLTAVYAGDINSQATHLPVSAIPARLGPRSTWRSR